MGTGLTQSIYFLQPTDGLRHPYESVLSQHCDRIVWLTSIDELFAQAVSEGTSIFIIDLDCLYPPFQIQLQQIRTHFPHGEFIALSSSDSSQLALQCIRTGFSDFLLKPASPEELSWSIKKSQQRHDVLNKLAPEDPRASFAKAITQISSSTSQTLIQLYSLEYLKRLLHAEGGAWLSLDEMAAQHPRVLCSVPKKLSAGRILSLIPKKKLPERAQLTFPVNKKVYRKKLIFPCQDYPKNSAFFWGIQKPLSEKNLSMARLLLGHAELSLLNVQKLEELKQQTFIDDLTGLYNSRFLKYAVTNAIMKCRNPKDSFSVLFIDVDHFKKINDQYGHVVGSEFLVAIGRTIRNAVRSIDPTFRYGGDEFVVILNHTTTSGAQDIAERIRKNIERRVFVIKGHHLTTTVSVGIATYPEHAAERETLLKLADEAMYSAKRSTRNAVHLAIQTEEKEIPLEKEKLG